MPQSAPLEIPVEMGFRSKTFDLNSIQQITPSGRGYIQTLERTTPLWTAEYTTGLLRDNRYDETIAFLDGLDGSMNTFLAFDPRRPMPRAYQHLPLASDPWTRPTFAAPRIVSFDYEASTLLLDRLATGAIISKGDYLSVNYQGIWYLFRSRWHAVADGDGFASIEVRPRPEMPDTVGNPFVATNIRYRKACAEMKMVGRPQERDDVDSLPFFSFKAVQFIDRSTDAEEDVVYLAVTESGFVLATEDDEPLDWSA